MHINRAYFFKIKALLFYFQKRVGDLPPLPTLTSCASGLDFESFGTVVSDVKAYTA